MRDCNSCAEKCPQAELAHQAALGRMYATNEFLQIYKKVESGELAPVVRCKDCKWRNTKGCPYENFNAAARSDDDFCSDGERRSE